jgi:hypothetical protein
MGLRPVSCLCACACALVLLATGCGGTGGGPSAPVAATPHLAETEVVSGARGGTGTGAGGGELQFAWAKAMRIAEGPDLSAFELTKTDAQPSDWYLVQACSFGGGAHDYWSNPVAHKVVPTEQHGGTCDPSAAWPPPAASTGDDCIDGWNSWIQHATIAVRSAAAAGHDAFAGRIDNRCMVILVKDGQGISLMQEAGGAWSIFDTDHNPPNTNAVVTADGTLARG